MGVGLALGGIPGTEESEDLQLWAGSYGLGDASRCSLLGGMR